MTGTVADIPDKELLRRIVCGGRKPKTVRGIPRYERVMNLFGLGSTYAWQLCKRFEVDPDERVIR